MNDEAARDGLCANCGAPLTDRYCGGCGQDSHVKLSLGHFLHEFVESLFHIDSTFWRSLRALVARPGFLTEQYLDGRRRSYAPPFRSYLIISIAYFLLASFMAPATKVVGPTGQELQADDCVELTQSAWLERFFPDLEGSCRRALSMDREAFDAALRNMLPKVMFVVLPLVALVQFWVYRRQRPLYLENLIFVLHFQSFYFLVGAVALLLTAGLGALFGGTTQIREFCEFVVFVWSIVYLFMASRRVYRAGAPKIVLGMLALALAYTLFWALGVSVAGMYTFLRA